MPVERRLIFGGKFFQRVGSFRTQRRNTCRRSCQICFNRRAIFFKGSVILRKNILAERFEILDELHGLRNAFIEPRGRFAELFLNTDVLLRSLSENLQIISQGGNICIEPGHNFFRELRENFIQRPKFAGRLLYCRPVIFLPLNQFENRAIQFLEIFAELLLKVAVEFLNRLVERLHQLFAPGLNHFLHELIERIPHVGNARGIFAQNLRLLFVVVKGLLLISFGFAQQFRRIFLRLFGHRLHFFNDGVHFVEPRRLLFARFNNLRGKERHHRVKAPGLIFAGFRNFLGKFFKRGALFLRKIFNAVGKSFAEFPKHLRLLVNTVRQIFHVPARFTRRAHKIFHSRNKPAKLILQRGVVRSQNRALHTFQPRNNLVKAALKFPGALLLDTRLNKFDNNPKQHADNRSPKSRLHTAKENVDVLGHFVRSRIEIPKPDCNPNEREHYANRHNVTGTVVHDSPTQCVPPRHDSYHQANAGANAGDNQPVCTNPARSAIHKSFHGTALPF